MRITGGSDLMRLQMLQKQAINTRNKLDTAALEMTSTQKASRFEATGGNLTRLFALERSLDRNAVYSETLSLSELRLDVMQESLGRVLNSVQDLSTSLVASTSLGDYASSMQHATSAKVAFQQTVATLNTQVAGQSLFAGATTDRPALASADTILADLGAAVSGATTSADALTAIDAFFARTPPGGFFTGGYLGSDQDLSPVDIGEGQRLDFGMRADDDKLIAVLKSQATAAIVANGTLAGNQTEQMALLSAAGNAMLAAKEDVLDLRTSVGILQETVENGKAERTSERETLDLARGKIVAVDPLEAASTFQTLEVQLQAIYTVTSRISNLRFVNYMS